MAVTIVSYMPMVNFSCTVLLASVTNLLIAIQSCRLLYSLNGFLLEAEEGCLVFTSPTSPVYALIHCYTWVIPHGLAQDKGHPKKVAIA